MKRTSPSRGCGSSTCQPMHLGPTCLPIWASPGWPTIHLPSVCRRSRCRTMRPFRTPKIFRKRSATTPGIFRHSFSRTIGRHTWKAGFEFTHFTMAYLQSLFVRGNFIFNGTYTNDPNNPNTTGDAFADFLLGYPAQTQRASVTRRLTCGRIVTRRTFKTTGASRRASPSRLGCVTNTLRLSATIAEVC